MVRKLFKSYQHLLDKKIDSTTTIVVIISFLIILVGMYIPENKQLISKNNVLESQQVSMENFNVIVIDGKRYMIKLEELR
ncbi:MAG: hypothetical protein PHH06_00190 [Candidatus Gracilibacteria bacterium]|nr:hypothetical protein [Candidatus Gracilibacteria bacterium]